jgi:hypothetical protein
MKKIFVTYSTDEKGIIHAHKEERHFISYSISATGKVTFPVWGGFVYFMQKLKER